MSHTPGPWKIYRKQAMSINGRVFQVTDNERYPAAFVPAWDEAEGGAPAAPDEALANARLIAAAPDLLEALKAAEEYMAFRATEHSEPFPLDRARAAIAKAEGRL